MAHPWCDNGPNWRGVMLRSAEQVLSLKPDGAILAGLDLGVVGPRGKVGVIGAQATSRDTQFEVRAFFPGSNGIAEDPVTGLRRSVMSRRKGQCSDGWVVCLWNKHTKTSGLVATA